MWIQHQQRRMFRGQGGATDRRLPKHDARRRRKNRNNTNHDQTENDSEHDKIISPSLSYESLTIIPTEEDDGTDILFKKHHNNGIDEIKEDSSSPYLVEIKHLKRRINNVQEISIQTSRDAIASDLTKYQNNVLNATQNCVNEWRSIARHYSTIGNNDDDDDKDNHDNGISSAVRTEVGLAAFQLIQLSVQSGPLSGGKPGYFKRCGAEVAKVVLDFLEEVVPQHDALGINCMGFTSNQMDAMKKWKVSAEKAIENDKPPSKSVMKILQKKGQQTKKTKKKS